MRQVFVGSNRAPVIGHADPTAMETLTIGGIFKFLFLHRTILGDLFGSRLHAL